MFARLLLFVNVCLLASGISAEAPALIGEPKELAPNHSKVPGVIIDYSPARTRAYIGCPSIAVLPNGDYVASHSWFGPGTTNNRSVVFTSKDKGKTWQRLTEIEGQWWSSLFLHKGALYLMGTSGEYGFAVIRKSDDGGKTWTTPKGKETGLLLADGKYHCAPVPVVAHKGRIWRAMEDAMGPGRWGEHFRSFMMSAPADSDLLNAENWTCSNRLGRAPAWLDGKFGGWLEGNAVVAPDGSLVNILRVDCPEGGKAAVVRISDDGKTAAFDPQKDFIAFPGGAKKFTIRHDPKTRLYWSLTNYIPQEQWAMFESSARGAKQTQVPRAGAIRNTLALTCSPDLRDWTVRAVILRHPDPLKHGFQYLDWLFEGDDLIAVCRMAHDDGVGGAHNYHDANYLTFHRIPNFRDLK